MITESLNNLAVTRGPLQIGLHEWIGREVITTVSETIYGPDHPFKDRANVEAWHQFGAGFVPLLVNFVPQLTAQKYVQAREVLVKAFEQYFEDKRHADPETSPLIKNRYKLFRERGLPSNDIARHEVGASLALLINTIQAAFWLVYHLFSNPATLAECRRELSGAVREENGLYTVDLAYIKASCPVFLSTFKETLRFRSINVAARIVINDTLIGEQYLLKKDSVVLIPGTVQHHLKSVYGDDAEQFNHRRFVRESAGKPKRFNPLAFRVFGGGSVVCPGRYFATTEILALAGMIALQFDVRPRDESWPTPTVEKSNPGISFQQPDRDIEVEVSPRDARVFRMTMMRSEETAATSSGDLVITDV
ncbi:hypothetical protein Daus18300_014419 [Diaporthe australafricana]|uniref:Cytochrome P450 n=1 Tax=Diaporthe australafricana TaxID=127596 RepID=A0ABR3VV90_9PEZI